jgi:hypothetical protein
VVEVTDRALVNAKEIRPVVPLTSPPFGAVVANGFRVFFPVANFAVAAFKFHWGLGWDSHILPQPPAVVFANPLGVCLEVPFLQ